MGLETSRVRARPAALLYMVWSLGGDQEPQHLRWVLGGCRGPHQVPGSPPHVGARHAAGLLPASGLGT